MAKLIIRESVEIYGDEYCIGQRIPYIYYKNGRGEYRELFNVSLKDINVDGYISISDKGDTVSIWVDCIEENKDMYRFEYRGMSGSYSIYNQGHIFAKTPQEAWEQLRDTVLSKQWNKETSTWKGDLSYVELFYNGLPCSTNHDISLFPKAYSKLNQKDDRFSNKEFLQSIADKISKETGISNKYFGIFGKTSIAWEFDYGYSHMENCAGNGLSFTICDKKGYEEWCTSTQNPDKFVKEVTEALLREINKDKENETLEFR